MMSGYEDLNNEFETILVKTARFVRMAFHLHSPGSSDWGRPQHADKARNDRGRFLADGGVTQFLDELAHEFEIVCVTDHMRVGFACDLARASLGRNDIRVFPGMEINCIIRPATERVHLLAIFPPDRDASVIDRIFEGANFPSDANRTGQEDFRVDSLRALTERVERAGGILIIAHVDDFARGHRTCFRTLREDSKRMFLIDRDANILSDQQEISEEYRTYIAESGVHAIEIMKPEDRQHYVEFKTPEGKTERIPGVIRCDAHCIEDFAKTERKTFVKIARSDFSSVRDALKFYGTRIKFKDDLLDQPSPRIVGIRLRSPGGNGLFDTATLAFNPNLNCIIGPRGCGKSTVIEALRYAFGQNPALEEIASHEKPQVSFGSLALGIQQANLADTLIEVIFETRGGERHCLSATYDPQSSVATDVFDLAGDDRRVAGAQLPSHYPIRIYSWSEVENLGRKPELQRKLLDRLVQRLPEYAERQSELYARLAENRALIGNTCRKLAAKLDDDRGLLRCFSEHKYDFERINTPEVAKLFEELDIIREKLSMLDSVRTGLVQLREQIDAIPAANVSEFIEGLLGEKPETIRTWWESEVSPQLRTIEIDDATTALVSQANSRIDEKLKSIAAFEASEKGKLAAGEATLRERTHAKPEEELARGRREQSKRRFDAATKKRSEYNDLLTEFDDLMQKRAEVVAELDKVQDAISGARSMSRDALEKALSRFAATDMRVSVFFEGGKDRDVAVEYMRESGFLKNDPFGHYKKSHLAERICRMASPTRIARAILTQSPTVMTEEGIAVDSPGALRQDEVDLLLSHFNAFSKNEDADVREVDADKLLSVLELQEKPWDDELRILLNDRQVDVLSPGQRSSAMLPLIALSETVPLIIDQPEDNLDNRMVGTMLTRILADLKERRQIIVATHNPNIVVGGDAEQVIVLDAPEAHRAIVAQSGSIDDEKIIQAVIAIMEGGAEAFRARERRYKPLL